MSKMKLLIFGASGATGVHLVEQALAIGYEVSAFVRDVHKLRHRHPKLTLIEGNVADAATVYEALVGQEAVLSTLGANRVFQFDPLVVKGLAHIVDAMTSLQIKRFIYLSTLGVTATRRQAGLMIQTLAPTLLRNEIHGHELREKIIQDSSLHWTIVRAPILTNSGRTETFRTGFQLRSDKFVTKLSRADVAFCLLTQLRQERFIRKAISIMP
jgi:putative NADH-flavin reductase